MSDDEDWLNGEAETRSRPAIDSQDKHGFTDLHQAVREGARERVAVLIGRGADTDVRNEFGWAPLHTAAAAGHLGIVSLLLRAGATVDPRTMDGHTPLDLAEVNHRADVIRLLTEARAAQAAGPASASSQEQAGMRSR